MTPKDKKIIEDAERDGIPIFVLTDIEKAIDLLYKTHPLILAKDQKLADEIRLFLCSLPDRDKLNIERDLLIQIFGICENTPELNMNNYTTEQVSNLNQSLIDIFLLLDEFRNSKNPIPTK